MTLQPFFDRPLLRAPELQPLGAVRKGHTGAVSEADGFNSPEEAALEGWPPAAGARVVSATVRGDRAEVVMDMTPSYDYWVYCVRRDGRWSEVVSGNGPTEGWDDPEAIAW